MTGEVGESLAPAACHDDGHGAPRQAALNAGQADALGATLAFAVLGLATVWVEPLWGAVFFVAAAASASRIRAIL